MLVEIYVDPTFGTDYDFCVIFDKLGWSRMLDFPSGYYSGLVHQFYANIAHKDKFSTNIVKSHVKGKWIVPTSQFLSDFFGAKDNGPLVQRGKTTITRDLA